MKRIEKAFEYKNWNEIKTYDSWQIFKIMAEFVQAFETLSKILIHDSKNIHYHRNIVCPRWFIVSTFKRYWTGKIAW